MVVFVVVEAGASLRGHDGHGGGPTAPAGCDPNAPDSLVLSLPPFVDSLPLPSVIHPARTNLNYRVPVAPSLHWPAGLPEYDVPMTVVSNHVLHSQLPPVEVWGYAGSYPGPTFDVEVDSPILVNWQNRLPATYPAWLPADTRFHGVTDQVVRTVVHLHGGASLPRYDGYPTNAYASGGSDQYFYGNQSLSGTGATLWYHDHALGLTGNNVYAGLAGFYLLRHRALESALRLPSGAYEIPLVFQDRDVSIRCGPATLALGRYPWHNLATVNGRVTPYFEVEPRKYRFRMLNGAGFRTFGLALVVTDRAGVPLPSPPDAPVVPPSMHLIGNDSGFLPGTVTLPPLPNDTRNTNFNLASAPALALMSGERADVIIDFSGYEQRNITIRNVVGTADPTNLVLNPRQVSVTNLLQFRVVRPLSGPDLSRIPSQPIVSNWVSTSELAQRATVERRIALDLFDEVPFPGPPFVPGDPYPFGLIDLKFFDESVSEFPHPGETEIWSFINLSNEAHPMHIHLVDFRVLDRIRFGTGTTNAWNGDIRNPPAYVGRYIQDRANRALKPLETYLDLVHSRPPFVQAFEVGPKDVVRAAPFAVTRIVVTWPTDPLFHTTRSGISALEPGTEGRYLYHCHLLEHEDNDMMRPLHVVPRAGPTGYLRLRHRESEGGHGAGSGGLYLGVETPRAALFSIQSTTDPDEGIWDPVPGLEGLRGTGGLEEYPLPAASDHARFYRVFAGP